MSLMPATLLCFLSGLPFRQGGRHADIVHGAHERQWSISIGISGFGSNGPLALANRKTGSSVVVRDGEERTMLLSLCVCLSLSRRISLAQKRSLVSLLCPTQGTRSEFSRKFIKTRQSTAGARQGYYLHCPFSGLICASPSSVKGPEMSSSRSPLKSPSLSAGSPVVVVYWADGGGTP